MAFLQTILKPPRYGFYDSNGTFIKPSQRQIWSEFFHRLNIFSDKRHWLPFLGWFATCSLAIPFAFFFLRYFQWDLFFLGMVYSMVVLGTHGTIYLHRYGTHRTFKLRNPFWIWVCRNLVIKIVPEEIYIVSHHVHHRYSEKAGDPYNVYGGWLYCFLADANHQLIAQNLSPEDYKRVVGLVSHCGVKPNEYKNYLKWGSIASPWRTVFHYITNWAFWYGVFFLLGGHALATALFGLSGVWAFGVRTFNYDGHGRGKDKRRVGIDFNWEDHSINQIWPGYVAGEWHNNHHLYPNSARNGFLPYQIDLAWYAIRTWNVLGIVSSYRNDREDFLNRYITGRTAPNARPPTRETEPPVQQQLKVHPPTAAL